MAEYCFHCLSVAADGDPLESADWLVLVTRDGEYLGAACSGCIADEDLALAALEEAYGLAA
jgi:hypothetical protein